MTRKYEKFINDEEKNYVNFYFLKKALLIFIALIGYYQLSKQNKTKT